VGVVVSGGRRSCGAVPASRAWWFLLPLVFCGGGGVAGCVGVGGLVLRACGWVFVNWIVDASIYGPCAGACGVWCDFFFGLVFCVLCP
jgi:hypothetical protein